MGHSLREAKKQTKYFHVTMASRYQLFTPSNTGVEGNLKNSKAFPSRNNRAYLQMTWLVVLAVSARRSLNPPGS